MAPVTALQEVSLYSVVVFRAALATAVETVGETAELPLALRAVTS